MHGPRHQVPNRSQWKRWLELRSPAVKPLRAVVPYIICAIVGTCVFELTSCSRSVAWALTSSRHVRGVRTQLLPCQRVDRRSSATACNADTGLYEVLGVDKDASVGELKQAYYREAKKAHPDKNAGDEAMLKRFQEVAEAYQTLADPIRRQKYDLSGLAGLAFYKTDASRLFGPPPWRLMIGRTDHWMWAPEKRNYFLGLIASSIPNGIAGVTMKTIIAAYEEALETRVAVLLDRVSEEQAKDTAMELEEYGLAVKAEPIEGERSNEKESPLHYFRRMQRELGEASEELRKAALDIGSGAQSDDAEFDKWVDMVRTARSELRAAAQGLEEYKKSQAK